MSHLSSQDLKHRTQKYLLYIAIITLSFEVYLEFKRRSLILKSLSSDDECPYILTVADLELL